MTELFGVSAPTSPDTHLVDSGIGRHLFVPNGSRLYDVDEATWDLVRALESAGDERELTGLLARLGVDAPPYVDDTPYPAAAPVHALSLAVAARCNLGCTYCYADGGSFGGPATTMSEATALAAVDMLLDRATPGERFNLAFMGGEPLLNRDVLRAATERAYVLAAQRGVDVGFSITTNGTRVTPDDGDFFEEYGFAVTVSVDGIGAVHDRLRPFLGGQGSFERIVDRITPLLRRQRRMQVSARVTVTPINLHLVETLDQLIDLGFHSVGFSPLLRSPTGQDELGRPELAAMLDQMVACGTEFERRVVAGERYPFANAVNALRELHRGTHRPYPCGAGAGYLGVAGDGELAACHRFVGDPGASFGSVTSGVDERRRLRWLDERHVHRQQPCASCWARYLCGGGCHHEVIARGRGACDYIRGWLHWSIGAYARLSAARPDYFSGS
jgi:uncharacterized protein